MKRALCTLQVEFDENNKDGRETYIYMHFNGISQTRCICIGEKKKINK